jgi:hypothetical protein
LPEPSGEASDKSVLSTQEEIIVKTKSWVVLATNIAFSVAKAYQRETRADGTRQTVNRGVIGFFSLEMSAEQLATRMPGEGRGRSRT